MPSFTKPITDGPLLGLAVQEVPTVLRLILDQLPADTALDGQKLYELLKGVAVSCYMSGALNGIALGSVDPEAGLNLVRYQGVDEASLIGLQESARTFIARVRETLREQIQH